LPYLKKINDYLNIKSTDYKYKKRKADDVSIWQKTKRKMYQNVNFASKYQRSCNKNDKIANQLYGIAFATHCNTHRVITYRTYVTLSWFININIYPSSGRRRLGATTRNVMPCDNINETNRATTFALAAIMTCPARHSTHSLQRQNW